MLSAWRQTGECCVGKSLAAVLFPALASFGIAVMLAAALDERGCFDQYMFFGDDCPDCLKEIGAGERSYNQLRHPNLRFLFGLPVQGLGWIAERWGYQPYAARRVAVLLISPLAIFVSTACLFTALLRLGVRPWQLAPFGLLSVAIFSNSLFSAIPSHFTISGAGLAVLYWLYVRCRADGRSRIGQWLVLGIVMTGVTTINLLPWASFFAVLVARNRQSADMRRSVAAVAATGALVAALTVGLNTAGSRLKDGQVELFGLSKKSDAVQDFQQWLHIDVQSIWYRTTTYPVKALRAFVAPWPAAVPLGYFTPGTHPRYNFEFMFAQTTRRGWLMRIGAGIAIALLCGTGCCGLLHHSRTSAELACLSWWNLLLFGLVYVTYGDDNVFLYSQHWVNSTLFLMAGVLLLPRRPMIYLAGVLTALALLATACSVTSWMEIFRIINEGSAVPGQF